MAGINGIGDHPGAASVEAMDTSDVSNLISSSASSRFTAKSSTSNKQQANKSISPGRILSFILHDEYFLLVNTGLPQ